MPRDAGIVGTLKMYDAIGRSYSNKRHPDPRLAERIEACIGHDTTVLNVGAGAGSYEPIRSGVFAVEPSAVMLSQRRASAAPAVRAIAEALPFGISTFSRLASIDTQLERLARDLASGNWKRRNAELRDRAELDVGYRLVTAHRRGAVR